MMTSSLSAMLTLAFVLGAGTAGAASAGAAGLEETNPPEVDLLVEHEPNSTGSETDEWSRVGIDLEKFDTASSGRDRQGPPEPERLGPIMATLQAFAWLCVILCAILVLYYLARRFGKRTPFLAGPTLGTILGRVHLSPRVCLHFVRIRDRVLVVGVTNTNVSRVAEFDAALFDLEPEAPAPESESDSESPKNSGGFLRHLQANLLGDSAREAPDPLPISREPEVKSEPVRSSGKPPRSKPKPRPEPEPAPKPVPDRMSDDDEIAALRDGIERLQKQIQDTSRELDL